MIRLLKNILLLSLFVLFVFPSVAQLDTTNNQEKNTAKMKASSSVDWEEEEGILFTPTVSLGVGMLTYYGDISRDYKTNNPITNRLAYRVQVSQPITNYLHLNFNLWRGTVSANERTIERNLNFESTLTSGGIALEYDFSNFIKKDRITFQPFVGAGFEGMEFLSKTDLYDSFGNDYYYWEDGTIRNLPESDPDAINAVRVQRDYIYETDIRELNADGFGDYDEYTFAFPVTAGFKLHLSKHVQFKAGATYFFTNTDLIDGVSKDSRGIRKGDDLKDQLLFSHFSLSYDFKRSDQPVYDEEAAGEVDALMKADNDSDGVSDFIDKCAATPKGVEVDEFGCPLDGDNDNVGNYKDQELNSSPNAIVDTSGVTYTDERLMDIYRAYTDIKGNYSPIEQEMYSTEIVGRRTKRRRPASETRYMVKVGEFEQSIPEDMINTILNMPDAEVSRIGNKVVVSVGSYDNLPDAMKRKIQLAKQGVESSSIITQNERGETRNMDGSIVKYDENNWPFDNKTVYRVQLGAFKKVADESVFDEVPNMLAIKAQDGYTRYFTGVMDNYSDATAIRNRMRDLGFKDAYVVGLKGGSKIPLQEAKQKLEGSGSSSSGSSKAPAGGTKKLSPEERKQLFFRVQIGTYREQVPTETLEKFMQVEGVEQKTLASGLTKFYVGKVKTYEEANQLEDELIQKGFTDAFVVAEYKGNIISTEEALNMIK